jgi:hypothetical protein
LEFFSQKPFLLAVDARSAGLNRLTKIGVALSNKLFVFLRVENNAWSKKKKKEKNRKKKKKTRVISMLACLAWRSRLHFLDFVFPSSSLSEFYLFC